MEPSSDVASAASPAGPPSISHASAPLPSSASPSSGVVDGKPAPVMLFPKSPPWLEDPSFKVLFPGSGEVFYQRDEFADLLNRSIEATNKGWTEYVDSEIARVKTSADEWQAHARSVKAKLASTLEEMELLRYRNNLIGTALSTTNPLFLHLGAPAAFPCHLSGAALLDALADGSLETSFPFLASLVDGEYVLRRQPWIDSIPALQRQRALLEEKTTTVEMDGRLEDVTRRVWEDIPTRRRITVESIVRLLFAPSACAGILTRKDIGFEDGSYRDDALWLSHFMSEVVDAIPDLKDALSVNPSVVLSEDTIAQVGFSASPAFVAQGGSFATFASGARTDPSPSNSAERCSLPGAYVDLLARASNAVEWALVVTVHLHSKSGGSGLSRLEWPPALGDTSILRSSSAFKAPGRRAMNVMEVVSAYRGRLAWVLGAYILVYCKALGHVEFPDMSALDNGVHSSAAPGLPAWLADTARGSGISRAAFLAHEDVTMVDRQGRPLHGFQPDVRNLDVARQSSGAGFAPGRSYLELGFQRPPPPARVSSVNSSSHGRRDRSPSGGSVRSSTRNRSPSSASRRERSASPARSSSGSSWRR